MVGFKENFTFHKIFESVLTILVFQEVVVEGSLVQLEAQTLKTHLLIN